MVTVAGVLATALLCPAVAAPPPPVHDGESPPARAWRKAVEAGDLAALSRMYDAGSVVFPPETGVLSGSDAIIADYATLFARYSVTVAVADVHWIEQPPLVVSWGMTTLTLHPKIGGRDLVKSTRFTDAAFARDGHWVYVVDHASAVPDGR